MMGGGAFILLKTGRRGPESTKQAEIRLANLLKILRTPRLGGESPLQAAKRAHAVFVSRRIPFGMANSPGIVHSVI